MNINLVSILQVDTTQAYQLIVKKIFFLLSNKDHWYFKVPVPYLFSGK